MTSQQTTYGAHRPEAQNAAILQGEVNKPANCFRLNGTGKIEEGLKLELNHPQVGGKPALFVGTYFIFRNDRNGVGYNENDGTVRRAIVEYREREGKKPLELLTQPSSINPPLLLHVDVHLPVGVKPKERFWSGVRASGKVHASSNKESLVSFPTDGSFAYIFYEDGSVKRVVRKGLELTVQDLPLEEQAEHRVEQTLSMFKSASLLEETDERIRKEDRSLHQLIAVLAIGGMRSQTIFLMAYGHLKEVAKAGDMRRNVLDHMMRVLEERFPNFLLEFTDACQASKFAYHTEHVDLGHTPKRSMPTCRKKKLAERAERHRQERSSMRGSSADRSHKGKASAKAK